MIANNSYNTDISDFDSGFEETGFLNSLSGEKMHLETICAHSPLMPFRTTMTLKRRRSTSTMLNIVCQAIRTRRGSANRRVNAQIILHLSPYRKFVPDHDFGRRLMCPRYARHANAL